MTRNNLLAYGESLFLECMSVSLQTKGEMKKDSRKIASEIIDPNTVGNHQMLEEFRKIIQQLRKEMKMRKPPSVPVTREFLKEMDKELLACQELRPLEKMFLNERRDLLLDASMEALPEMERKYIEYRYGFAAGKPILRSEVAKILDVPEEEVKRIEADALEYFRDCFHVDRVNAFYELRPEAMWICCLHNSKKMNDRRPAGRRSLSIHRQ